MEFFRSWMELRISSWMRLLDLCFADDPKYRCSLSEMRRSSLVLRRYIFFLGGVEFFFFKIDFKKSETLVKILSLLLNNCVISL